MTIQVKPIYQSGSADDPVYEISSGEWNQGSTITLVGGNLVGRATAGDGAAEEITCTSAGRAILDDADAAAQRTTLGVNAAPQTSTKTDDYTILATDNDWTILFDATVAKNCYLTAAATLGATFRVTIRNIGTANVTIDPNGSETIDGLTTLVLEPGRTYVVVGNATAFYTTYRSKPIGTIEDFGGTTVPAGYLLADGSNRSRTTYEWLFAIYGTTFGNGDGSTTFGTPDLRGRATFGKDDMGGTAADRITSGVSGIAGTTLGAAGGTEHMHEHYHGPLDGPSFWMYVTSGATQGVVTDGYTYMAYNSTSTASAGTGSSENMTPALIVNKMIYAGV